MTLLSLLAAQKMYTRLTTGDLLANQIAGFAAALNASVPAIGADQIVLSSASPDIGDQNMQLSYPRICVFSSAIRNTQAEKFRSFSGQIGLVADIWASADLVTDTDQWIHVYVASIAAVLQSAIGDWGDGIFYGGSYDVQFQSPKAGGLGFVESARLTLSLNASLN